MLQFNGFVMPVSNYDLPLWGSWVRPVSLKTWFGVRGALALMGGVQYRECVIQVTISGMLQFTLHEIFAEICAQLQELGAGGTLDVNGTLYTKCIFMGWTPDAPAFYDGSGQHKWVQMGKLSWMQIRGESWLAPQLNRA